MYIRLCSGSDGAASLELIVQSFTFTTCHVHTCAKVVAKKQDCGVLLFVWELSESWSSGQKGIQSGYAVVRIRGEIVRFSDWIFNESMIEEKLTTLVPYSLNLRTPVCFDGRSVCTVGNR